MFFMYILLCNDNSYYIGHTDNMELRFSQHQQGKIASYTSVRLPVKLVFAQSFSTRIEAIAAEHKTKKWSRKKKEALIAKDWQVLSELAKKRFLILRLLLLLVRMVRYILLRKTLTTNGKCIQ